MDYYGGFILQKDINWSLLNEGLIKLIYVCSYIADWDVSILTYGVSEQVKILIDGEFYDIIFVPEEIYERNDDDRFFIADEMLIN